MAGKDQLLVRAARGEQTERPPVWLMRQAGRYIPEYRRLRREYTFKEAIIDPTIAERITLLPWDLFRPDGVVMFSDILTVVEPLGFEYHIEQGVGPVIENPVEEPDAVDREYGPVNEELEYVGELLGRLQASVGDETSIIGFSGGPFTLASYVVAGGPSRHHHELRAFRSRHPNAFDTLLHRFANIIAEYLAYQVEAGADVVQLFDTYAGILSPADYREFILPLHERILRDIAAPSIIFVRNPGGKLELLEASGADVVGLDWTVDMETAREQLGDTPVQGNLDPSYLRGSKDLVRTKTRDVIEAAGNRGHILNLGHGIHKDTPVENVRTFVETARNFSQSTHHDTP
jgi:uroporphyrinogen decarboxylase